ncbi:hypothetical protein B0H14DRAFT_3756814 [Mycena olivaceomarginata]|nr:hypothetical protein B0H14DRAFT_3756814 [Mycena olivaceomarginata]
MTNFSFVLDGDGGNKGGESLNRVMAAVEVSRAQVASEQIDAVERSTEVTYRGMPQYSQQWVVASKQMDVVEGWTEVTCMGMLEYPQQRVVDGVEISHSGDTTWMVNKGAGSSGKLLFGQNLTQMDVVDGFSWNSIFPERPGTCLQPIAWYIRPWMESTGGGAKHT